jgi:PadR family transcriptional regulator PadR
VGQKNLPTVRQKTFIDQRAQKPLDTPLFLSYLVGEMSKSDILGHFEFMVLSGVASLSKDDNYGMKIHLAVEEARPASLGAVYTTLDRLEQKGYVKSSYGGATEERGGRSKRYFELTGHGATALKKYGQVMGGALAGLKEIGGLA